MCYILKYENNKILSNKDDLKYAMTKIQQKVLDTKRKLVNKYILYD